MLSLPSDGLMDCYYQLAGVSNITDMESYANSWMELADEFDKQDRPEMASLCRSRGVFYGGHLPGSYQRVQQGVSLVDLIPLS